MGNNDTLKNLLIAGAVFVLVMVVLQRVTPPVQKKGGTVPPTGVTQTADQPTGAQDNSTPSGTDQPQKHASHMEVEEGSEQVTLTMGSSPSEDETKDPGKLPYRMGLTLSNVGASIDTATLTDHEATLKSADRYKLLAPVTRDDGTTYRSLAIEKIRLDGEDVRLDDKVWQSSPVEAYSYEGQEGERASFWITVLADGKPAVEITHTFELPKQKRKDGRHDLWSTITIKNVSTTPHEVLLAYRGGVGVPSGTGRSTGRMLDVGVLGEGDLVKGSRWMDSNVHKDPVTHIMMAEYDPQTPDKRPAWVAVGNTYFTCTVAPLAPDRRSIPDYISQISAYDLDQNGATTDDATVNVLTTAAKIAPGKSKVYQAAVYIGEKDADSFRAQPDYAARNYYYQITKSFGACTFTALVELMLWMLNTLDFVFRDYGLSIIALVMIVRILLHPITKKTQVNMVRMQKQMGVFTPKMEEVKKKYPNDKAKQQQEMMKLYREHGINPAGQMFTCLPMVIQMPIWIALFLSLSNNILMRHQPAFFGLLWIDDLTAQDALYTFAAPLTIPFVGWKIQSFNLLPLLVAAFMYLQQKTQPKPAPNPNATAEQRSQQEMMQKMMPLMSVMMLLIFYKMPAGLNLYIMCSSMFGWLEQKRIRAHIKEQEDNGTFDKPTGGGGGLLSKLTGPKKDGSPGFWEKIQKAAEQAQKEQPSRKSGKQRK